MTINPRTLWALLYAGVNIIAYAIILTQGALMGDLASFAVPPSFDLTLTLLMVCASIFGLLGLHAMFGRLRIPSHRRAIDVRRVSPFMTLLLLMFIVYVAQTGLFIAGSTERTGSIASAFWVIFSVDSLFLAYYAACRETRGFKFNLLLWVLSFLQRGWFGFLFLIIAIESVRLIREKRLFNLRALIVVLLLIAAYPLLDLLKVYVRTSGSISFGDAINVIEHGGYFSNSTPFESLQLASEKIVGRIQLISHAQVVTDHLAYFGALSEHRLKPFWQEGVVGVILARLTGQEAGAEPAQALASFIAPNLEGSWNVNPSLVGWLAMNLNMLPLAIAYVICLCFMSAWLHKQMSRSEVSYDRLWLIWLIMLIPGWIAQFVSFVLAQVIFLVVARLIEALPKSEKSTQGSDITNRKPTVAK